MSVIGLPGKLPGHSEYSESKGIHPVTLAVAWVAANPATDRLEEILEAKLMLRS